MAVSPNSKIQANADASVPVSPGWYVLAVLSLLMGFASISTDLYLPAMPAMSRSLHADAGMVEFTISGYLIGFSLGQLLWGPIGDRYGRRISVAIGLVLFVIDSAGCALSGGALSMIGWRMVQALGACASVALSRAMVRDLYEGNRAAQMFSTLITVMAIAPLIGPLVGGQIVAIQYGSDIVGSGLVGAFADGTPWPMGWVIGVAGIGSLLSMRLLTSMPSGKTGRLRSISQKFQIFRRIRCRKSF